MASIVGTGAADRELTGTQGDDDIQGLGGNDWIQSLGGDDTLLGGIGSDALWSGSGADTMVGSDGVAAVDLNGNDTYHVDNINDVIIEFSGEGTDRVHAYITYDMQNAVNVENIRLVGFSAGIDAFGNDLDNVMEGNREQNTLAGGLGDDSYVIYNETDASKKDVIVENAGEGSDTYLVGFTFALGSTALNIENITLTGTAAISATGNDGDNILTGNVAKNTLTGGLGDDTYVVQGTDDVIKENAGGGNDTVATAITYTLEKLANVENIRLTGTASVNATGNAGVNILTGNTGGNTLNGGLGADTLAGGKGGDIYVVDNAGDILIENAGEGTDLVMSSVTFSLAADFEHLTLTGSGNISGTGNDLDNIMTGNAAVNTLTGGLGDDQYFVQNSGDVVIELAGEGRETITTSVNYNMGANAAEVEVLVLSGTSGLSGTGNAIDNTVIGNGGANLLAGGAGDDTLLGGGGNDALYGDDDADSLDGGGGNDTLYGGNGNDALDGTVGADTMTGGAGNDGFMVDNVKDVVLDGAGMGVDSVASTISYALASVSSGSELENLALLGGAVVGIGNELDNIIGGNGVSNTLSGGGGDDRLFGDGGSDTLDGGTGSDSFIGGQGDDVFIADAVTDLAFEDVDEGDDSVRASVSFDLAASTTGEVEKLFLTGSSALVAAGNALDNTLGGNGALNTLIGRAGGDTYVMDNTSDLVTEMTGEGFDTIASSVTYVLAAATATYEIEGLTLTGTENINATGNTAANLLKGNAGVNTLAGGLGDDSYVINDLDDVNLDTLVELAGGGTDTVVASISFALQSSSVYEIENVTLNGTENINAGGNDLDNILTGNDGNNSLNGSSGNDTMIGGLGNDTYFIDAAGDVVAELMSQGVDTVNVAFSYSLTNDVQNVENLTLTGAANIDGEGSADNNVLTGNIGINTLTGLDGNDTLDGGVGADRLIGGVGNDVYIVNEANDVIVEANGEGQDAVETLATYDMSLSASGEVEILRLMGSLGIDGTGNTSANIITGNLANNFISGLAGDDTLLGMDGDDHLFGGDDDDTLDGGAGIDVLDGGDGDDVFIITSEAKAVIEAFGEGIDEVRSLLTHTLAANVENLTLTGGAPINGFGNGLDNTLLGNEAVNTLNGGAGVDHMIGAGGNDTFIVDDAMDFVEGGQGGADTVLSSVTYDMAVSTAGGTENLVLTGASDIDGYGNADHNTITGNSGANTMDGAEGDDFYVVQSQSDVVLGDIGEGKDTVLSSISWALNNIEEVENIFLQGTASVNATGNDLGNSLIGNSGKNILNGGLGDDTYGMGSSASNDTIVTDTGGNDGVEVGATYSVANRADLENIKLLGTGAFNATGNASVNILIGNAGKNTLNGGIGADVMFGGTGDDTYLVDNVGDVSLDGRDASPGVEEIVQGGKDLVISSVSYGLTEDIENLTLENVATALNGSGNDGVNVIKGNSFNNVLDGGQGADSMDGGAGNDSYYIDTAGEVIKDASGVDTVYSLLATYTLGKGLENLTLIGVDKINGTGNTGKNIITGNAEDNVIDGGKGADTLIGGGGDDVYVVDTTADMVVAGGGTDTVNSSVTFSIASLAAVENLTLTGKSAIHGVGNDGDNTIIGNTGVNSLTGGEGNDYLSGGAGADILIGGNGNDIFAFEGATAFLAVDKILDFHFGEDTIVFDALIDPLLQVSEDFIEYKVSGSNVNIYLDYDAKGDEYEPELIAILVNPTF